MKREAAFKKVELAVKRGNLIRPKISILECNLMRNEMREKLADLCHKQWIGWMKYLFSIGRFNADGTWTMPQKFVARWHRQIETPYSELSKFEQDSDREEAGKFIEVMENVPYA